jgi:hypothetical protein
MYATLTLKESAFQIEQQILKALAFELNARLIKVVPPTTQKVIELLRHHIKSQPEYISMGGGKLQAELGVVDARRKLDRIIDVWTSNVKLIPQNIRVKSGGLEGGINMIMRKGGMQGYQEILSMPEAIYVTKKGVTIEWLRWLLLEGHKTIVQGYQIGVDRINISRTGLGKIMVRGRGWGIPDNMGGTADDNFITRALFDVRLDLERAIQGIFG